MEKGKKGVMVVIGLLIIAVIALTGMVLVLLSERGKETKVVEAPGQEQIQTEAWEKDEDESNEKERVGDSAEQRIVLGGFAFSIPSQYSCTIADGIGPIIYVDDMYQMKLVVRDTSYEELMKDPEGITEPAIEAGGTITKDVTEMELDGQSYVYFCMDLDGDQCLVVNTKAVDENKRFAAQFAILSEDVTEEDLLYAFADVVRGAVETDEPDTTVDDWIEQSIH